MAKKERGRGFSEATKSRVGKKSGTSDFERD